MSRVYIVQQPAVWDRERKIYIPKTEYNFESAERYGPLTFLIGPGKIFHDRVEQAACQIGRHLEGFTAEDYLVPVGDSIAVALATMFAARRTGGTLKILRYLPATGAYESYLLIAK